MLEGLALWLLLPMGIALGWALGRNPHSASALSDSEMIAGLTLAQDNPDRAIAALTKAIERDPAAVELNLTLGALFRKRGEIDRALRLHEGVLTQNELKPDVRALALYELGQDCVKAGLLDRAEEALSKAARHPAFESLAYEQLLPIHEQVGEWTEAMSAAERLESLKGQSYALVRAHYALEMAERARDSNAPDQAIKLAKRALEIDPACVRANLFLGQILAAREELPAALAAFKSVAAQDPRFLREVIPAVEKICSQRQQPELLSQFLDALEAEHGLDASVWLARAQLMRSDDERMLYLADKLSTKPTWHGLILFLALPAAQQMGTLSNPVQAFRSALQQLVQKRPSYRCEHCGFTPSLLFWRCPSCKQWGKVAPIEDTL